MRSVVESGRRLLLGQEWSLLKSGCLFMSDPCRSCCYSHGKFLQNGQINRDAQPRGWAQSFPCGPGAVLMLVLHSCPSRPENSTYYFHWKTFGQELEPTSAMSTSYLKLGYSADTRLTLQKHRSFCTLMDWTKLSFPIKREYLKYSSHFDRSSFENGEIRTCIPSSSWLGSMEETAIRHSTS